MKHPHYQRNSIVTETIAHDMVSLAHDLAAGKLTFDSFLPATLLAMPEVSSRKRTADSPAVGTAPLKAFH
jgi:hypothetical protein